MKMIYSILIANRGEIASRIIRTCRKMGIRSIAIFSDVDQHALYVKEADLAISLGGNEAKESYLNQNKIIEVAKENRVDAIHPGYGFLSENEEFARRCADNGIIFIGPSPEVIGALGSKAEAKKVMLENAIPVVPGYNGSVQDFDVLRKEANAIGYPILIKASSGGGGKGMRIVSTAKDLQVALDGVKREASSSFGSDEVILEKYIESGRHIEFQILGDHHGHLIHILERECTIQRRFQKIIEESPSSALTEKLREEMGQTAVKVGEAIGYNNAGTVEFIFDNDTNQYYFLEVNTRLQVEHPVTEEITGLDLVQLQIEIAQGQELNIKQENIISKGYALECRLYAEDPSNDFNPVSGIIHKFSVPEVDGFRLETSIEDGSNISIYYDPMIAKLIVSGENRKEVSRKMSYVLSQMICLGTTTNQSLLKEIISHPKFIKGEYDTNFVFNEFDLTAKAQPNGLYANLIAATVDGWIKREKKRKLLKGMPSGWRNSFSEFQHREFKFKDEVVKVQYQCIGNSFQFIIGDKEYMVGLNEATANLLAIVIDDHLYQFNIIQKEPYIYIHNEQYNSITLENIERFPKRINLESSNEYVSPMPSQVVKVEVKANQKVSKGDVLLIISSMKMENSIVANEDGIVEDVYVEEGENIEAGTLLLKMKE